MPKSVPSSLSRTDKEAIPKIVIFSNSETEHSVSKHADFIKKDNTCQINSILHALSVIPFFWCQLISQIGTISLLLRALTCNMSLLKHKSSTVDT